MKPRRFYMSPEITNDVLETVLQNHFTELFNTVVDLTIKEGGSTGHCVVSVNVRCDRKTYENIYKILLYHDHIISPAKIDGNAFEFYVQIDWAYGLYHDQMKGAR